MIKLVLQEENPLVQPGRTGKVFAMEESDFASGYAVLVDWGDGDIWSYDTPESSEEDLKLANEQGEQ